MLALFVPLALYSPSFIPLPHLRRKHHGAPVQPRPSDSLAYNETGVGSAGCAECGVITAEQARKRALMETAVFVESEKTRRAKQLFPNCFQELKT